MIKNLVLPVLLVSVTSVHAQNKKITDLLHLKPEQRQHLQLINSLVQTKPQNAKRQKPTAIKQRVVAQAYHEVDYSDSSRYSYTGVNGSSYNYDILSEPGYSYSFYPDMTPAYNIMSMDNPSTDIMADSISNYFDGDLSDRSIAFYNASGQLDSAIEKNLPDGELTSKLLIGRNSEGLVTSINSLSMGDAEGWGQRRLISYTASAQVLTDSTFYMSSGIWNYSNNRTYHYDVTTGRLDTLLEEGLSGSATKYVFTYDAEGRLISTRGYRLWPDSPEELFSIDTIGYTEGFDYFTSYGNTYYGEGETENFRLLQYPGSHPGPDSIKVQMSLMGTWFDVGTGKYTYNAQGNPTSLAIESIDPEEGNVSYQFYYEDYDDGLSNNDLFLNKDFAVYPNPFTNNISLDYTGKEQKNVSVSLADITGRTVFQSNIHLQSGNNNIAVPELSAGTYILQVEGKTGKLYSNKLIKK